MGFTSTYGGVYLLRGRNHMCQIVETFPDRAVKLPSQHFFELAVGRKLEVFLVDNALQS